MLNESVATPGAGGAGDVGELDQLEELAKKATPGPWDIVYDTNVRGHRRDVGYKTVIVNAGAFSSNVCDVTPENRANAAYIAAVDPTTVLAIVARVRDLEAERDALRALLPRTRDGVSVGWCDFVYNTTGFRYVVIDYHLAKRDFDFSDPDRRVAVADRELLHVSELYSTREAALAPNPKDPHA